MNVSRAVIRQFATSNVVRSGGEVHKGYAKLKDVQQKFQQPDGKPVFLKGGAMDQVLYRFTVLLCLGGVGGMVKLFWDLSVPKTE
ncbi:cytochrome c oxidase subunit 7A, mitochondrial-like [Eupeodes corollae]|uniref:cytochrome c oxidase subunit 7A, mitochondrial-like n=1 Tax=Eupeodes corollae TaxID=290404 RepID=UPI00248F5AB6|nr:cytochrome c oxidase subunit 7A, mitochondrial-like [Eupeodes corollae]